MEYEPFLVCQYCGQRQEYDDRTRVHHISIIYFSFSAYSCTTTLTSSFCFLTQWHANHRSTLGRDGADWRSPYPLRGRGGGGILRPARWVQSPSGHIQFSVCLYSGVYPTFDGHCDEFVGGNMSITFDHRKSGVLEHRLSFAANFLNGRVCNYQVSWVQIGAYLRRPVACSRSRLLNLPGGFS